jgi:WD40 repeat protein
MFRPASLSAGAALTLLAAIAVGLPAQDKVNPAEPRKQAFPEPTKFDPKPGTVGDGAAEVLAVAYSPDRETLATGGADKAVRLWEVASGKPLAVLEGHADAVAGLSFSPDGKALASAGYDHAVKLWDLSSWRAGGVNPPSQTLTGHKNWVLAVAFSPDGLTLASASSDRTAKLWDVATGQERAAFTRHRGSVRAVAFSPDGSTLATGSTQFLWPVSV